MFSVCKNRYVTGVTYVLLFFNNIERLVMQLHQPAVVGRQHHRQLHLVHSRGSHQPGSSARKFLSDRNSFIAYAMNMGTPVPKTICVEKGNVLPHLVGFKYPLWVRASQGDRSFYCQNETEKKSSHSGTSRPGLPTARKFVGLWHLSGALLRQYCRG